MASVTCPSAWQRALNKSLPLASFRDSRYERDMTQIRSLFATRLYRAPLSEQAPAIDFDELEASCWSIAEDDEAGQEWCDENNYPG